MVLKDVWSGYKKNGRRCPNALPLLIFSCARRFVCGRIVDDVEF